MTGVASLDRAALAAALDRVGADGWLLFNFKGLNPVASRILGLGGLGSRRLFVYVPREGEIVALAHKIELTPLAGFPGRVMPYARHGELHDALRTIVQGRRVAMEVYPGNGVPYLDRIPAGVVEMVTGLGGTVVSSGELVTRFASCWSAQETADHCKAGEIIADIARKAVAKAVTLGGTGYTEYQMQQEVVAAMTAQGVTPTHDPIVGFGPNAADPHYEPAPVGSRVLEKNQVVLLDLFGALGDTVPADQTWMGFSGTQVPEKVQRVWVTVRDARDAAIRVVQETVAAGKPLAGYQVDQAARAVIEGAGFGDWFVHRTGHSIDRELHGSGPHCDDYETHDDRLMMPGVGFSIEPGIYLTGDFGVRSEVNMYWGPDGPRVTPDVAQMELIVPR